MRWFRQYPVFASLIATSLAAIVLLTGTIALVTVANHRSRTKLKKRQHELRTFVNAGPLLNESAAKLIGEQTAALERQNEARLRNYPPTPDQRNDSAAHVPTDSTDAFFALTAFDERMAQQAKAAGVEIADDERFGFATYARSGPEKELIPAVHAQRLLVEKVLDRLFAAHPEQLVGVARERPAIKNPPTETTAANAAKDFFSFTPQHAARTEGRMGSSAIRVSFVSDTTVLREFVNSLVECEPLLLVRGMEAEATANKNERQNRPAGDDKNRQTTLSRRTKFTVTIEAIDFQATAKPAAASL
jgi:hypothetical protein